MRKLAYSTLGIIDLEVFPIFINALLIRIAFLVLATYGYIQITMYDISIYTGFGKKLVDALMRGDLEAAAGVNVGTPPLGMLLTGLSIHAFGGLVGEVAASMIPQTISSSLTVFPVYLMARKYSERAGLAASLIYSLDPYLMQFSLTYLDPTGTLFTLLATLLVLEKPRTRNLMLSGMLLGLASLTKLTFIIYAAIFTLMLVIYHLGRRALLVLATSLPMLLLIPWLWFPDARLKAVEHHLSFNSYLPVVFVGPELIGVPQAHAWYILSYLGMGQVFWNTLPFITPLILLSIIIHKTLRKEFSIPLTPSIAASSMILTIFFLPRNYWTYSWGGGTVQGVLSRQFYPYYFYPVGPFIAVLAAALLSKSQDIGVKYRIISYPILLAALISPLAVLMNIALPYWDFIFTLIYSYSMGQWIHEGLTATTITSTLLVLFLICAELLHRKLTTSQRQARQSSAPDQTTV